MSTTSGRDLADPVLADPVLARVTVGVPVSGFWDWFAGHPTGGPYGPAPEAAAPVDGTLAAPRPAYFSRRG
jgi:hypothetical protein